MYIPTELPVLRLTLAHGGRNRKKNFRNAVRSAHGAETVLMSKLRGVTSIDNVQHEVLSCQFFSMVPRGPCLYQSQI